MSFERKREIIDFDLENGTYQTTYDYPSEPPSVAVALALMEVTGRDVTDFDPLYEAASVDPDALDEMFRPKPGPRSRDTVVEFTYHEYEIQVKDFGRIVIRTLPSKQLSPSN
ncbi:HalOD1 output domain-containing protein [Halorussus salinus]|uniref:HalOD1 output domain-containing protein n=1 Tax=Halorussus salinus TaxID=1364935 RepID=UPI001091A220|nr:HalOD1 output domain-containing protein [Halorussus salinus]